MEEYKIVNIAKECEFGSKVEFLSPFKMQFFYKELIVFHLLSFDLKFWY